MAAPNAPNFLVIGVQKAGTTYLCDKLAKHPDIFFSTKKEPMFFQRKYTEHSYRKYLEDQFGNARGQTWRGEGSTVYFQAPKALRNISSVLSPDLKIILCLRHPTEKAVSQFMHNWRRGRYPRPIKVNDAPAFVHGLSPRASSLYYQNLCRWLSMYSRRQIEILLFDKLQKNPDAYLSQALNFLDLDGIANTDRQPLNKGTDLIWEGDVLTVRKKNHRWRPEFHKSDLMKLHESYIQDIERLEDLLQLGISHWKEFPKFTSEHRSAADKVPILGSLERRAISMQRILFSRDSSSIPRG